MKTDQYTLLILVLILAVRVADAGDVVIALHQSSTVITESTVRVGDIADVFGGAPSDRREIVQLDLESLRDRGDCSITKKQVEMRLLLAGYKREVFEITGPAAVTARRTSPARLRNTLERLIEEEIARQFAIEPDRVVVRLSDTPPLVSLEKRLTEGEFTVDLIARNEFPIGRARLSVEISDSKGMRYPESLDAQVSLMMKVALAKEPISQGTLVGPEMLQVVDREISAKADYANPETVVGRAASRYIASNSILLANHLVRPRPGSAQAVKRNDLLDVVIMIGQGEIRLKNARAMESGQIGDTIEVLNPQTNGRISASIIGPNLATVSTMVRR